MKKNYVTCFIFANLLSQTCHAAMLCGAISKETTWDSGVFSVIDSSGNTISTTSIVATGTRNCTSELPDGNYIIRFTGTTNKIAKPAAPYDSTFGCITAPYAFKGAGTTVAVVFNNGRPPFNGNNFCSK